MGFSCLELVGGGGGTQERLYCGSPGWGPRGSSGSKRDWFGSRRPALCLCQRWEDLTFRSEGFPVVVLIPALGLGVQASLLEKLVEFSLCQDLALLPCCGWATPEFGDSLMFLLWAVSAELWTESDLTAGFLPLLLGHSNQLWGLRIVLGIVWFRVRYPEFGILFFYCAARYI